MRRKTLEAKRTMHIPDGMLSPGTCGVCVAAMVPIWGVAAAQTRRTLRTRQVPLLSALSAFSFTVMLFNVPVIGGTTAHAIGGTLLAIALGPWAAVIGVSIALAIQALLFADGGILAFGANCLTMAFVGPFLGYAVYRLLTVGPATDQRQHVAASGVGAYVGLNAAALTVALLLGMQPHLAHGPDGKPLYFPFALSATLPGMMLPHLLVAGFVEGAVTAAGYAYLARRRDVATAEGAAARNSASGMYWVLVGLIVLAPLGLLAPGSAWGEWASEDILKMAGYVPQGLAHYADRWKAPLTDYQIHGAPEGFIGSAMAYYLCTVLGVGVILILAALLGRALTMARLSATAPSTGEG